MFTKMKIALSLGLLLGICSVAEAQEDKKKPEDLTKAVAAAREKGLDWLTKHQAANGSWGKTFTVAVTSWGCLSYLSGSDEPFSGDRGQALIKGLQFLMANQKEGSFPRQGNSWIHGQGFATLALSEAYGRSLLCKDKPDIDTKKIRAVVADAVKVIAKNQSTSGGWWYTTGTPDLHEGSTTVCAVQALVSAGNFGIDIDQKVLDKGFEYLKNCQSPNGGFNYKQGDGTSMKEGTAADVATLALMKKFDFTVMINGYKFLVKLTPAVISTGHFPYYGHFYGCMGMHLLGQEYKDVKEYNDNITAYLAGAQKDLVSWQQKDGNWPLKGWALNHKKFPEDSGYATAFATLTLFVTEGRLSIYNREPPKLPK